MEKIAVKTHLALITAAAVIMALVITYEEQLGSFALGIWWWVEQLGSMVLGIWWWVFGSGAPPA